MCEQLLFSTRTEFREWLTANSTTNAGIWLIFGKNRKIETLTAEEALEEALCFGWIDGQITSLDETKYIKKFTPRRKGSKWSEKNKNTVCKLIDQNLMTEKGLAVIEEAKKSGVWNTAKAAPITEEQISILVEVLSGKEPAFSNFQKMSPSVRRTYAAHYLSAKAEETKKKRLEQIVQRLNENKKPM